MQISTIALALVLSLAGRQATAMDAPCYSTTSSGAGLRALVLTTSHDKLGNESCTSCKPTGVYGEEFTTPYYVFKDAGAEVTLASIKGGSVFCHARLFIRNSRNFLPLPLAPSLSLSLSRSLLALVPETGRFRLTLRTTTL